MGYCDIGETGVQQCLIGQLKLGQVVVINNASFHKLALICELIEQTGSTLLFLPSYTNSVRILPYLPYRLHDALPRYH